MNEHEYDKSHPVVKDTTGLSWGYRTLWRIRYAANDVYGPASRQPGLDPREQLRAERAQRVALAYRAEGKEPPPAVLRACGEDSDVIEEVIVRRRRVRPPKPFQEGYRYFMVEDDRPDGHGEPDGHAESAGQDESAGSGHESQEGQEHSSQGQDGPPHESDKSTTAGPEAPAGSVDTSQRRTGRWRKAG